MSVTRREAIQIGAVGAVAGLLVGCRPALRQVAGDPLPERLAAAPLGSDPDVRLLNRVGFGPAPGDLDALRKTGRSAWLESQLIGDAPEPLDLTLELHRLDVLRIDGMELRDTPEDEIVRQLQQAAILRAVYSPNQLRERMVDFWTNHFNIYARKGFAAYRKGRDETQVVRNHALGSFPEMLKASAQSPAMLVYLDNISNFKGKPNENYARELLELHSLGVDGGYTQKDIQEVARCFSGWNIERGFINHGKLKFEPAWHDDGEKVVLGRRIPPGGGPKDAEIVLDLVSYHPSTAKFLAKKLTLYFLGDRDAEIEAQVAKSYLDSNGDIPSMLRPLLSSERLTEGVARLKRPYDFVVSALRATAADSPGRRSIQEALRDMGQPVYEWPMPDGYPIDYDAWSGSLLSRWNFAIRLSEGQFPDVKTRLGDMRKRFEGNDVEFLATLFFGVPASHPTVAREVAVLEKHFKEDASPRALDRAAALCMCAPPFQWS